MKKAFFAIAFLWVLLVKGQTDSTVRSLRFNSAGIQLGAYSAQSTLFDQDRFASYAPGDTSLRKDFSGFKKNAYNAEGAFHFSLYTSFIPSKDKKTYNERIEFRIGLIYQDMAR